MPKSGRRRILPNVHFYDMVEHVVDVMYAVPPHDWASRAPTSLRRKYRSSYRLIE